MPHVDPDTGFPSASAGAPLVVALTSRRLFSEADAFWAQCEAIAASGVDAFILREKDLNHTAYLAFAERFIDLCRVGGTTPILHGDLAAARSLSCNAIQIPLPRLLALLMEDQQPLDYSRDDPIRGHVDAETTVAHTPRGTLHSTTTGALTRSPEMPIAADVPTESMEIVNAQDTSLLNAASTDSDARSRDDTIVSLASYDANLDDMVVGTSVHSRDDAELSKRFPLSYLIASNIFVTDCKKGLPGRGIAFLEEMKSLRPDIPLIALGGIDEQNASMVLEHGADGVALMSGFMRSSDPASLVDHLHACS
jgi:thiamine monophosphate synthase